MFFLSFSFILALRFSARDDEVPFNLDYSIPPSRKPP